MSSGSASTELVRDGFRGTCSSPEAVDGWTGRRSRVSEDRDLLSACEPQRHCLPRADRPVHRNQSSGTEPNLGGGFSLRCAEGEDSTNVLRRYPAEFKLLRDVLFASHRSGDGWRKQWRQHSLKNAGFFGWISFSELTTTKPPPHQGVHVVARHNSLPPEYLDVSVGVRFKGIDPTMEIAVLEKSPGAKLLTKHHTL